MSTTPWSRWVAVALFAVFSLLASAPASAHSALIGSNPEPDATIQQMPENIELEFNESVSDISPAVVLRRDGETVAELDPVIDGSTVSAASPDDLAAGDYSVVWRVVSGDGHPIDGTVPFTLAAGGQDADRATPEPSAEASDEDAAGEASQDATDEVAAEAGQPPVTIGLIIAALVVLGVAGALWYRRRQRAQPVTGPETDPDTTSTKELP